MKSTHTILLVVISFFGFTLYSCNNANHGSYDSGSPSPAVAKSVLVETTDSASPAAVANQAINSPERKIIRTADLRCRVKDVFTATTHIESTVKAAGGIISDSRMDNEPTNTRTLPYKQDSLRQVQSYTTTAHLTLRVPVQHLDSVLIDLASQSAFINSRHLQLQDVTLQYLSNDLKNKAAAENDAATRAKMLARRSREAVAAGEYADERNENRIDRHIENMGLLDNVRYATLQIDLYQPERIDAIVIANTDYQMKPTIGQRARMAVVGGWGLVQDFLLVLINIWPLVLLAIALLVVFRIRRNKRLAVLTAR